MHKTNHAYLDAIYDQFGTRRPVPKLFRDADVATPHRVSTMKPLEPDAKVLPTDFVEDLQTGQYEPVGRGYYTFLRGLTVKDAMQLPDIAGVARVTAKRE